MGRKKKKNNNIIVTCMGASIKQVTGSHWVIKYNKDDGTKGILHIESGLPQGEHTILSQYNAMKKMKQDILYNGNIENNDINTSVNVIISHAHIDHLGLIPIFNDDNGFKGNIYVTKKQSEISKKLLKDCFKIHNSDVKYLKLKGRKVDLLYTESQLYNCFYHYKIINEYEDITVDSNLKLYYRTNSHTIDSTNIMISIKKPNTNRWYNIWYSGDLGNDINYKTSNYLSVQDLPTKMDFAICEGTYTKKPKINITKSMASEERKRLKELILSSLKEGKRILFPTFSFSRSQQLITYMYEWFKDDEWINKNNIKFVMDSNLMLEINKSYSKILEGDDKKLFDNVMNWDKLKKISTYDGTMAFLSDKSPSVVFTSSGFMEAGKVMNYLPEYLGNSNCVIILTGYCSQNNEGSMGWKILNDEQKTITFNSGNKNDRKTVLKRANIYQFKTFSGHASYEQLMNIFGNLKCSKIILHHMEEENKKEFIEDAKEYLLSKNKTTPIVAVGKGCYEFKI